MESRTCEYCDEDILDDDYDNHVLLCKIYYDNLEASSRLFSNRQIPSGESLNSFVMEHFHIQRNSLNNQNPNHRSNYQVYSNTNRNMIGPSRFSSHFEPVYVGVTNIDRHLLKIEINLELIEHNCIICLDKLKDENDPCKLICNHYFCTMCIKQWLKINKKCPLCKFELEN